MPIMYDSFLLLLFLLLLLLRRLFFFFFFFEIIKLRNKYINVSYKVPFMNFEFESCWVEIINDKEPNILLGVFYRHPNKKDTKFTHSLLATLKKIRKENKKIIISGDFNFDLLQHGKNEEIDNFLNSMLGNNLQPCITEPTRIVDNCKPSLVNNIFINTLDNPLSGNLFENLSYDHLPNFIIIESKPFKNDKSKTKTRQLKNFNQQQFSHELRDPNLTLGVLNARNSNLAYNIFHKKFQSLVNKHAPLKYLSRKEAKLKQNHG